jgi:hypothetical protein
VLTAYAFLLLTSHRNSDIVWWGLDPMDYVEVSRLSLLSADFWTIRPFTVPLAYKLMAQNAPAIVLLQVGLHFACWAFLAFAVLRSLRGRVLRWVGFAGVLLFSLTVEVNLWNLVVISESINHSLTAAFVGVVLLYLRALDPAGGAASPASPAVRWGWPSLILLVGGLWSFCRDTTPYAFIAFAPAVFLVYCFEGGRRRFPVAAAVLLAVGGVFVGILQIRLWAHSARAPWTYTVTTNLCNRVLPYPEEKRFFLEAGMPDSAILMRFSGMQNEYGQNATGPDPDPALVDPVYDAWVLEHGRRAYVRYMIARPLRALGWAWDARHELAAAKVRDYGVSPTTLVYRVHKRTSTLILPLCTRGLVAGENALTEALSAVLFGTWPFFWPSVLLACLAPLLFWRRSRRPELFVPIVLYAWALQQGVLVVLADCIEIGRHGLGTAIFLRFGFWLAVLWVLDEVSLAGRRAPAAGPGEREGLAETAAPPAP